MDSSYDSSSMRDQLGQEHFLPLSDADKQCTHLRTLQEISCNLNSQLDLDDALTTVLDEAIRALGAERGCLLLEQSGAGNLEVYLSRHLSPADLKSKPFQFSHTVIERVWRTGQPVLTANAKEDPRLAKADSVINYMLRSILCVPLHVQGKRIGVLYLDNTLKAGQFQGNDLALAVAIADQAAIALRNAQLHQEVSDRAGKLMEALQHVQFLNEISFKIQSSIDRPDLYTIIGEELEHIGYRCAIALLNPASTHLEIRYSSFAGPARRGDSDPEQVPRVSIRDTDICRQVLASRAGARLADLAEIMDELIGVYTHGERQVAFVGPVVAHNQIIGLLVLAPDDHHPEHPSLLVALANHVAAIIRMSCLHARLQQRLAEMQSMLAITRAMVTEISLDRVLEFIMAQAEYLTDAQGAAVLLLTEDKERLEVAPSSESWLRTKAGATISVQGSLVGLTTTTQQVQVSNQAEDDEQLASVRDLLRPTQLHSLLCAPLVVKGDSLGALLAWNKHNQGFNAHDHRLMETFADQAALAIRNAQLHEHNRQLAVEQERHRLARDLHDSVTQALYSIGLAAQTSLKLLSQTQADSQTRGPIEYIHSVSRTALEEMREQLYDLHPSSLVENGLVDTLARHCKRLQEQHSVSIRLSVGHELPLSICKRETLYYIAKEALWNVIKHAGATHADVLVKQEDCQVVLCVADDGTGFDLSTFDRDEAIGLRNMEDRAELAGGTFELESSPGQGTRLIIRIPVDSP